jgi:catechol 2,3-dioxygenase-like lactoylglutathione lyase family enzyme
MRDDQRTATRQSASLPPRRTEEAPSDTRALATRAVRLQLLLMTTSKTNPTLTSFAPQFLVDDLARSIAYYQKLGFAFGEPWGGFYAIGQLDGLELHLKEAPKNADERLHRRLNDHLDAAAGVDGIEAFYAQCAANGVTIIKPLTATEWGTKGFYVEDPDGYIVAFGGRPSGDV